MKNFAKIFNVPLFGQVLVTLKRGSDSGPELIWSSSPPGFDVCDLGLGFSDDEIGWDKAEAAFEKADQAAAATAVSAIWATVQVPKPTQSVDEPVLTVSPDSMDVTDMLELEGMIPVDGYDEIYKHYATTFGRTPDAFMQKVVEETKQRLLMWFFSHRETIRAALVLQESMAKTSTAPTTSAAQPATIEGEPLYRAVIGCRHSIDRDSITLYRDEKLPGNALAQLAVRLEIAMAAKREK